MEDAKTPAGAPGKPRGRSRKPLPIFARPKPTCEFCRSTDVKQYDSRSDGFGRCHFIECHTCGERWKWVDESDEGDCE